ncbi:MAG: B12-binding domain-containing radical SAM protein [Saprospiraceae bacterium]|nr:B12-binding domain-containing radical SAM protein [Saprospiraceae bacterium]
MQIILSHGYYMKEDPKELKIQKPYPPLGILYVSAYLEQAGYDNDVLDSTFISSEESRDYLLQNRPDILGLYCNLMTKLNVLSLIQFVKASEDLAHTVIVLGGPDVRYNLKDYLSTGADVAIFGEGEQTMLEVVKAIENEGDHRFLGIPGVAFLDEAGDLVKNAERSRIRPIDALPLPNRHKIDMQPYLNTWKRAHGSSAMTVSTQRGCPFTCKWCSTAVYGQSYRRRSPEKVAAELKMLKATYGPDSIWFVDDVFTVSHKWLKSFRDEVLRSDAMIPFECISRADRMNEEVIGWLKEAGCFRVWIGAESGSQKIIDLMDRRVQVDEVREMIQKTRSSGMEAGTFIMLGYPGETEEDIKETVHHLKVSNPDHFTITIAYPIKGTGLYEEVEAKQKENLEWTATTDRDRDFTRTYSKKYYEYAVRWVENEVRWHQQKGQGKLHAIKLKGKALAFRNLMRLARYNVVG